MIDYNEKNKIKEVLKEVLKDLNVNPNINMAYFLNKINETSNEVDSLKSQIQRIINNQNDIEYKLDYIIRNMK